MTTIVFVSRWANNATTLFTSYCEGASIRPIAREQARTRDSCEGMAMMAHHATTKFLYAVDCNYHGNELVLQEATTRIIFFMSWYCTTSLIAARRCEIAPYNNQHSLNWCWNNHNDCKGAKAPVIQNVWDHHPRGCDSQDFYVVSQQMTITIDSNESVRSRKQQPTKFFLQHHKGASNNCESPNRPWWHILQRWQHRWSAMINF